MNTPPPPGLRVGLIWAATAPLTRITVRYER